MSAASKFVAFAAGVVTIVGFLTPLGSAPAVADTTPTSGPADAAHASDVATAYTIPTVQKRARWMARYRSACRGVRTNTNSAPGGTPNS